MLNISEGYGIKVSDLEHEIQMDDLLDLIKKAPKLYERMKNNLLEHGTDIETCEPFDILVDWVNLYGAVQCGGLAEIMQEVIEEKEDIRFDAVEDDDGNAYLIFSPSYPWIPLTEEEKVLTEEKIEEIINKYISIITSQVFEVEYYIIEIDF